MTERLFEKRLLAMPSAGLESAMISALLLRRLFEQCTFIEQSNVAHVHHLPAFPGYTRFAGASKDEAGLPLGPRPKARRRALAATGAFDAGPATTMPASQRRSGGHGWRGVSPSCGDGHG
jgi:hypothetical protein